MKNQMYNGKNLGTKKSCRKVIIIETIAIISIIAG